MGDVLYRTRAVKLGFLEEKPTVYKVQKLKYPVIREDELVTYCANSAAVPKSTIKACMLAIAEAIAYFTVNGHRVQIENFGSFGLKMSGKIVGEPAATKAGAVTNAQAEWKDPTTGEQKRAEDFVRRVTISFQPIEALQDEARRARMVKATEFKNASV